MTVRKAPVAQVYVICRPQGQGLLFHSCNPALPGSRVVDFALQNRFLADVGDPLVAYIWKAFLAKVAAATLATVCM